MRLHTANSDMQNLNNFILSIDKYLITEKDRIYEIPNCFFKNHWQSKLKEVASEVEKEAEPSRKKQTKKLKEA